MEEQMKTLDGEVIINYRVGHAGIAGNVTTIKMIDNQTVRRTIYFSARGNVPLDFSLSSPSLNERKAALRYQNILNGEIAA